MLQHLHARTGQQLCEQTLRTYAIGSRQMSVQRLIDVCAVLGARADVLLGNALRHAAAGPTPATGGDGPAVSLHLPTLLASHAPQLAALHKWAQVVHAQHTQLGQVDLNRAALTHLTVLTGTDGTALRATLLTLDPSTPAHGPDGAELDRRRRLRERPG